MQPHMQGAGARQCQQTWARVMPSMSLPWWRRAEGRRWARCLGCWHGCWWRGQAAKYTRMMSLAPGKLASAPRVLDVASRAPRGTRGPAQPADLPLWWGAGRGEVNAWGRWRAACRGNSHGAGFRPAQNGIMASASEWVQHVSCCPGVLLERLFSEFLMLERSA